MAVWWQNKGRVVWYWPLTNSLLLLGVLTSVPILMKIDQEMRPWECPQTDTQIHWQTDRRKPVFTAQSVCVSVCQSVICDNTKESSANILIPHDRTFIQVLKTRRMVGRGRPLLPEIVGQSDPVGAKTPIFNSLVALQPLHLPKKSSIITNRKSITSFPMGLRWTSYVAPKPPPPKWLKNAKWPFSV